MVTINKVMSISSEVQLKHEDNCNPPFMHVKLCKQKLCKKVAFWVVLLNRTIAQGQILELFYVNVFEFQKTSLFVKLH